MKNSRVRKLINFLVASNSGVALIEFAVSLPLLFIMLLGMLELSYYILLNQKLDKLANSLADFVTQGSTASVPELSSFAQTVPAIMQPLSFSGSIILSSVVYNAGPPGRIIILPGGANNPGNSSAVCSSSKPCVSWQYVVTGSASSQIGNLGGGAVLPGKYTMTMGQNVIAAEVFMNYAPLLSATAHFIPGFSPATLYKTALFKPRQGTLTTLTP